MKLVEITEAEFNVELELRYASHNNFTGNPIYSRPACFLNEEATEKLQKAIHLAGEMGYRFKLFDAFRPTEAVQALWDHTPNPDYLAPPTSGSPHARGAAIDLTLLDASGQEMEMGTDFDAMTPLSHHAVTEIPVDAQRNRALLLGIMTAAGWDNYMNEWWHYQLFKPRRYPTLSDSAAGTNMMGEKMESE